MTEKDIELLGALSYSDQPLVSIVVPAYNSARYIERTLKSILVQTYENLEVIVVDDGSLDSTVERVGNLSRSDHRIRVICQMHAGVSVARNRGIKESKGDYLIFLDSDDYLEPDFVSVMTSMIISSDSDIAYCGYRWVNENGDEIRTVVPKKNDLTASDGESVLHSIFVGDVSIWTGSAIYRKSFIRSNNLTFVPGAVNGQDTEFIWKAVLVARRIVGTKKVLSNYLIRKNSLVKNSTISKIHKIGCSRRIGVYLRNHTKNDVLLSMFERRLLPRSYTTLIYFFAIRGFPKRKLIEIVNNRGYRSQLKRISLRYAKLSEYLATFSLVIAPRLTIWLFRTIGRRLRKDLVD